MSEQSKEDDGDGRGCLFFIGLIIVGLCVGSIYGGVAGWLVIGIGFVLVALLSR